MRTLNILIGEVLVAKFTVEELFNSEFISTRWFPAECLENDRSIDSFETYSGALCHMYALALEYVINHTHLRIEET